jgi:mannose-6-phosphate isomerase-like protein (cupin superfamily)
MVIAMLLSLLLAPQATTAPKPAPPQTAAPPKTAPAPQQPATPPKTTPAPRTTTPRAPAATAVAGMAITATDGKGQPFGDVSVELSGGAATQNGKTNEAGQINFPGLRAGTYRLRFFGEGVTAFEREVTLKAGDIAKIPITLTAAEPPKPVAAAPPPVAAPPPPPAVGPVGQPQLGSLTKLADQQKNTKERREVLLSCSGNTRNVLLVLTEQQPTRIYDGAEATFYVISGQGAATVGKIESVISAGSFVAVPRNTPFSLARQGRQPLALLWTLSGEPCESAR